MNIANDDRHRIMNDIKVKSPVEGIKKKSSLEPNLTMSVNDNIPNYKYGENLIPKTIGNQ